VTAAPKDTRQAIAAPRAAAIAGVIFSVLLIVSLGLVRLAVPADPTEPGGWLTDPGRRNAVRVSLNLVPFAGIAFLWFVGVIRSRLGRRKISSWRPWCLAAGCCSSPVCLARRPWQVDSRTPSPPATFSCPTARLTTLACIRAMCSLNVFAIKMAAVFMFSTCTIGLRTAIFPRWAAFVGYACALILLVVITNWAWIALLFPLWVLLVSTVILSAEFGRRRSDTDPAAQAANRDIQKATAGPRRGD
jgi:hypothetical protein